jgi:hypothetical protein
LRLVLKDEGHCGWGSRNIGVGESFVNQAEYPVESGWFNIRETGMLL